MLRTLQRSPVCAVLPYSSPRSQFSRLASLYLTYHLIVILCAHPTLFFNLHFCRIAPLMI